MIDGILEKAGSEPVNDDVEFVKKAEDVALICGYKPIELCWMACLFSHGSGKLMFENNWKAMGECSSRVFRFFTP